MPMSLKHICAKQASKYLLEALLWVLGVALLAFMNPQGEHLFSFCPVSWIMEGACLGCGLGHGIAYVFRGEWGLAWEAHPLAIPALLVLGWRCVQLVRWFKQHQDDLLTFNKA